MNEVYVVTLIVSNETGIMPYSCIVAALDTTSHDALIEAVLGRLDTVNNVVMQAIIDKIPDIVLIELMKIAISKGLYI